MKKTHILASRNSKLINKIYKLLPLREEKKDYLAEINKIIEEVSAIRKVSDEEIYFTVQYKLEWLKEKEDFFQYRSLIFEILSDIKRNEQC